MADNAKLTLPGHFQKGKKYLIPGEILIAWRDALQGDRVIAGPGIKESQGPGGRIFTAAAQSLLAPDLPCHFGKIIIFEGNNYLQGGVVSGGDSHWNVADLLIDLSAVGEKLIWLRVNYTANNEDAVLMPGLETCSEPTWHSGSLAGGYPDNTSPDIESGAGTRIIPLGKLTIAGGAARFNPTGCGNISLGFCPPNSPGISRG